MADRAMAAPDVGPPPLRYRIPYYLFETRVPPRWAPWVRSDIGSPLWYWRRSVVILLAGIVVLWLVDWWLDKGGSLDIVVFAAAFALISIAGYVVVPVRERLARAALARQERGWSSS